MRKGFNGLYGLVCDHLGCDPERATFSRSPMRGESPEVVVYDHSGLWICSKKLDGGRFGWPGADTSETKIVLSHEELAISSGGIDLADAKAEMVSQAADGRIRQVTNTSIKTGESLTDPQPDLLSKKHRESDSTGCRDAHC